MAALFFPLIGSNILTIGSFNIHGLGNKLENQTVYEWIDKHDIIFLCETKTDVKFTVPGYHVIYGTTNNPNRGGVAFLIKRHLKEFLTNIDISEPDQIWLSLSVFPGVQFGGCYVPPHDSLYYNDEELADFRHEAFLEELGLADEF